MWKKLLIALMLAAQWQLMAAPENFHRVADGIYRSGQPSRAEFRELAADGFKSDLNLREYHSDKRALRGLGITEYRFPVAAGSLTEEQLFEALKIIRDVPRPILIHCWHGSDRTGAVVAAYRIAFEQWPVTKALEEMRRKEFGFHDRIYRNIPELLESIDWDRFRTRLFPEESETSGSNAAPNPPPKLTTLAAPAANNKQTNGRKIYGADAGTVLFGGVGSPGGISSDCAADDGCVGAV